MCHAHLCQLIFKHSTANLYRKVQAAVGDKLGYLFQNLSTTLGSLAIAVGQVWSVRPSKPSGNTHFV